MINRLAPQLPADAVKTYSVVSPLRTHYRSGSCAEAQCPNREFGWRTVVDERTELGQAQAHYIRKESGRRFTEEYDPAGTTTFTFAAGQNCFTKHQISLEREPLYLVRGGDFRGNPRQEKYEHDNADNWVDDFANHQNKLADRRAQG